MRIREGLLAFGSWLLAAGIWHLALGSWRLAVGDWLFLEVFKLQSKVRFVNHLDEPTANGSSWHLAFGVWLLVTGFS